jgi:hypothetical protein
MSWATITLNTLALVSYRLYTFEGVLGESLVWSSRIGDIDACGRRFLLGGVALWISPLWVKTQPSFWAGIGSGSYRCLPPWRFRLEGLALPSITYVGLVFVTGFLCLLCKVLPISL